jgi:phosphatidylserine/phosphatidylglycerophosphate/cardiolipin synthase-like enzyme
MALSASTHNDVTFFMDGSNFFPAVDQALQMVKAAAPSALTYVRMAFWMAEHDMPLADPLVRAIGVADLLETRLREVAMAGHAVDLILFAPSQVDLAGERLAGGGGQGLAADLMGANQKMERFLNGWTSAQGPGSGRIRVFLEKVDRQIPGTSNHQKIVICSIAGQRMAFIGGFNLLEPYWDSPAHAHPGHTWHDTGVRLRGPATDAVEAEWMRRWRKSGLEIALNATPQNTYAPVGGDTVKVTVATTNAEGWFREPDIQRELVRHIGQAKDYIYFENYGFSDPTLVDALSSRFRAAAKNPPPSLFVNLAWPSPPSPYPPVEPYDFLDYISWSKVALQTCASVDVPDPSNPAGPAVNVPREGALTWQVRESGNAWSSLRSLMSTAVNRWMEQDALVWQLPGGPVHHTLLTDIVAIHGGVPFYTSARAVGASTLEPVYLHSKLALFDDRVAVVGTANFTYRSMVYDGEIALIIENQAVATGIRQTLFTHFNTAGPVLDPSTFAATAAANRAAYATGGLYAGNLYVLPLEMGDYTKTPPRVPLNFTWY